MYFFVVPGRGTTLLGLPDMELMDLLSNTCGTTVYHKSQMNTQRMEP